MSIISSSLRSILAAVVLTVGLLPPVGAYAEPPSAPTTRDPRFGLNEAWRAGAAADRAGAHWSRILFWWSEFQKGGPKDFDLFATGNDEYIGEELRRGRELAAAIMNTPRWASVDGSPNGVPKNLYLPWDHRDNHWGQFTRHLAEHYRGRIDNWIIWNEVDIRAGQWSTWNGSVEDYVQLLAVAYRSIKAANPKATVLPFGAAWWYDRGEYLTKMLDVLAAKPEARAWNHYFDVGNLHLYSRANDIPMIVPWFHERLAARGMSKPVWVVETNAVPYDDPIWPASKANFRATMDEQAAYIIQAFASYLAHDVQRISVNRAVDGTDFEAGGEPFGLVRNDGSARPAFTAYQVVTRYFSGANKATYIPPDPSGLTRVILSRDGERVTVVWTIRPTSQVADIEATTKRALMVTKYGETQTVEALDGRYRVPLQGATANSNEHDRRDFVVGGDPLIIVERTDGNPTGAYRPLDIAPRPGG